MSKHKLFAIFALGTAFALAAALPASARDREDKAPRNHEPRQISSPAKGIQPGFSTSGDVRGKISVQRQRSSSTSDRPDFMQKAICGGSCGNIDFICWGESASCFDGLGCIAEGGGWEIILVCL